MTTCSPTPASRAGLDPDRAAALLAGLVGDASAVVSGPSGPASSVASALAVHREIRESDLGVSVGAMSVHVSRLGDLLDALDASPSSTPLDLELVADTGLVEAAEARAVLLDDDRVDIVGLRVSLPPDGPLGDTARLTLTTLDFALPAVIDVPAVPDWADALAVLAEDGAERVGIRPGGATAAAILREAVVLGVPVVIPVGVTGVVTSDQLPGVLNVLAGVSVALDGADVSHVTAVLAERNADDLLAIVASADPRAVRGRLVSVGSHDVRATLAGLRGLGLLEEDIVAEESST